MDAAIEVKDLSYIDRDTTILDQVSFSVKPKEILSVIGPNGAGKSTLIKSLVGAIEVYKGEVNFPLYDRAKKEPVIGYVPQHSPSKYINFPLTVEEFIQSNAVPYQKWPRNFLKLYRQSVESVLFQLSISHLINKRIDLLSGGEFQKTMIASALFLNPDILILDEPSIALDSESREKFLSFLKDLSMNHNCSIVIVSHDVDVINSVSSNILYLDRKVKFFGKLGDYCDKVSYGGCFESSDNHLIWHNH